MLKRFIQLRSYVLSRSPFFATLLLNAQITESKKIPTMGVDIKGNMMINPEFVETLDDQEFSGVICHEVLHLALQHVKRSKLLPLPNIKNVSLDQLKNIRHQVSNYAADIIVNNIVAESKLFKLPAEAVGIKDKYSHMSKWSLLAIYKELLKDLPKDASDINLCFTSEPEDEPSESSENSGDSIADVDWDEILQSAVFSESKSYSPNSNILNRFIELLKNESRTDYREILTRYIQSAPDVWDDHYDRRFIHNGIYLDTIMSTNLNILFYIDASGSIDLELLQKFLNELHNNLLLSRWAKIDFQFSYFDTKIYKTKISSCEELLNFIQNQKIPGGGGTDILPVYTDIQREIETSSAFNVVMIFTDGYFDYPQDVDNYLPILWCLPLREHVPSGFLNWAETNNYELLFID